MEPVLFATGQILAVKKNQEKKKKKKKNPGQDLLSEAINSISGYNYTPEYDHQNLKLLVKEINDMKYKIQNMEKNNNKLL